jgi:hypothetical protein
VTTSAEQFGTNVRATVATAVPNLIRGAIIPLSLAVLALKPYFAEKPLVWSSSFVGIGCFVFALGGLWWLRESFGADLDYVERDDRC